MVGFFYIAIPFLILWGISHLLFGRVKARSILFWSVAISGLYLLCFIAGLFFSFWFEQESYWHSLDFNLTYWDAHAFPPGATLAHALKVPYIAAIQFVITSWNIITVHFNWSFAVSYGTGLFILINWISASVSCYRMRNPRYGF